MAYYDHNLWPKAAPERIFLRLLGLFDRPMQAAEFQQLKKKAEFAKPLKNIPPEQFNSMITHLKQTGLLNVQTDAVGNNIWDAHPLVREYFGQAFEKESFQQFKQAHLVLFKYFQTVPDKKQPDTLAELEPLYRAVHHGGRAGAYKKAKEDVLRKRIHRGKEFYSQN